MTSTHQHHSRYSLPPPPQNSQNDFRLPSLKDLNFAYRPLSGQAALPPSQSSELSAAAQQEHPQTARQSQWGRSVVHPSASAHSAVPAPHQQHTPPLSAGHDMTTKVEYPTKHENGGYAHPGIPLSAQASAVQSSVNVGPQRSDNAQHSPAQPKRRTASTNMNTSRDIRPSHSGYPPQYASYAQPPQPQAASPYHQIPSGLPGPSTHAAQPASQPPPHEQMHHHPMPVSAHPGYTSYQHAYMQPRQPAMHPPPTHQQSLPTNHSNPYPSPGPPPAAPPPQGPWAHQHQQPQHPQPQQQQQPSQHPHHQQHAPPPQSMQHAQHPSHIQQQHMQQQHTLIPSNPQHSVQQQQQQPPPAPAAQAPPPQQQQQQQQQQPQYAPQYQQQQQQPQHQPQHQPQMPFARTTAIVPTSIDARAPYPVAEPERVPSVRNDTMTEITNHCNILYSFASRYAQLQHSLPHAQPSAAELEDMSQRALTVVRLLEELRQMNMLDGVEQQPAPVQMQEPPEDPRPPKRPWEDISQDDGVQIPEANGFQEQQYATSSPTDTKPQTTAEQDMELIRTKRATSTAGANGSTGQPKSKYRKRSRASPPGKCHSCNSRETPEWRRGPDGARTLCNACGLHYAKLMRKRDKAGQNGEAPHIDLETLRASARAADIADKSSRSSKQQTSSRSGNQQQSEPDSPMDSSATVKPVPLPASQSTHQGSFQLVNMMAPPTTSATDHQNNPSTAMQVDRPPSQLHTQQPGRQQGQQQHPQQHMQPPITALPPPPPWPTTAASIGRGVYAPQEQIQHQSFMRGSQQASR